VHSTTSENLKKTASRRNPVSDKVANCEICAIAKTIAGSDRTP
jgi:hypothetical protein